MLWDEYVEEKQNLPDLCIKFLNNTCSNDHKTCPDVHWMYPFLWQCEYVGQWINFPEVHSKELESAFRIVQADGARLSPIDAQKGNIFFDPNLVWNADFDRMCIQKENKRMNIRRLSTVSSVMVNDSMATSYEWYFRDDKNRWIKYGTSNINNKHRSATTTSSNDMEKYFSVNKINKLDIQNIQNTYSIDFDKMTQKNKRTGIVRAIRRRVAMGPQTAGSGQDSLCTPNPVLKAFTPKNAAQTQSEATPQASTAQVATQQAATPQVSTQQFVVTKTLTPPAVTQPDIAAQILTQVAAPQVVTPLAVITQPAMQQTVVPHVTQQGATQLSAIPQVLTQVAKPTDGLFEWQFKGLHDIWVAYGSTSQGNGTEFVTTNSSDDIESQFLQDPTSSMMISSGKFQYQIDFNSMTQTNINTSVQRTIRRIPKQGIPATQHPAQVRKIVPKKRNNFITTNLASGVAASCIDTFEGEEYDWFFKDEHDQWIKYGQSNTAGQVNLVTKTSSNDIEAHFNDSPTKCMTIESSEHKYLLDFIKMTQTNEQTRVERAICRKAKNSSNLQENVSLDWNVSAIYEWFFKDDKNTWIKYGENNKQVGGDPATSTSSDDIEKHFCQNPNVPKDINTRKHSYIIDFTKMTQTNKETNLVRQICRRAKILSVSGGTTPRAQAFESLPSNWSPMNTTLITIQINSGTNEFTKHSSFIKQTLQNINILKMYRIQNPYLWKAFANKKAYMREKYPGIKFREEQLFHGTDSSNVKAICEENVDWRLHGTSTGQMYGRGSYFSNRYGDDEDTI